MGNAIGEAMGSNPFAMLWIALLGLSLLNLVWLGILVSSSGIYKFRLKQVEGKLDLLLRHANLDFRDSEFAELFELTKNGDRRLLRSWLEDDVGMNSEESKRMMRKLTADYAKIQDSEASRRTSATKSAPDAASSPA